MKIINKKLVTKTEGDVMKWSNVVYAAAVQQYKSSEETDNTHAHTHMQLAAAAAVMGTGYRPRAHPHNTHT